MGRSRIGVLAVVRPDAGNVDGEFFEESLREIHLEIVLPAVLAQVQSALPVVGPNRDAQETGDDTTTPAQIALSTFDASAIKMSSVITLG